MFSVEPNYPPLDSEVLWTGNLARGFSNPARGPTDVPESLLTVRSLVKTGNEIQRCGRLYELCRANNGPDL